jgi:hypothetical protein
MNGNFTLQNVPAKSQKIFVSIVGYAPVSQVVTVSTGQTSTVSLQLGQTSIMASEVVFIVLNAGVKYQAGETVSLSMLCRNIGNVQYEEAEWFCAPGCSYVMGVDCTF